MVTVAMIVVAARVYAQARLTKQFGLSDYLMICSITIICGFASLISVQYRYGWGRHQACIGDLQEVETQLKFNVTGQSFGIMGSTFGRLSFIVFMLHLFDAKTWPRLSLRVFFVLQVVTNVGTVIACYAQCSDPRALYDFSLPESLCWPAEVQTVSPSSPSSSSLLRLWAPPSRELTSSGETVSRLRPHILQWCD